jgi:biopolymer transport protein ExbB
MAAIVSVLVKGGLVMIPLVLCSVVALAVILERAWFWWQRFWWQRASPADVERLLALADAGKWEDAVNLGAASRSPVARVLAAGVRDREPSAALAMEAAAQAELAQMKRGLPILDTIITLAPLLGLLGTVTGMIGAFGVMAESGINQPHAITGGVAEALIATAAGLVVAIVALVPYNAFTARVEATLESAEQHGSRLELILGRARAARALEERP